MEFKKFSYYQKNYHEFSDGAVDVDFDDDDADADDGDGDGDSDHDDVHRGDRGGLDDDDDLVDLDDESNDPDEGLDATSSTIVIIISSSLFRRRCVWLKLLGQELGALSFVVGVLKVPLKQYRRNVALHWKVAHSFLVVVKALVRTNTPSKP